MENNNYKFVAVLNKKIDTGKIMNALAHMSLGLVKSNQNNLENMGFIDYIDKDNNNHKNISRLSFIILKADNSNQIRTLKNRIKEKNIPFTDFVNTMTENTYIEQLERTKNTFEKDLEYYGICFFGEINEINELTKKFSLWH